MTMTEQERMTRNLHPTLEARVAMCIWGRTYADGGLGSMDFWDQLSEGNKRLSRLVIEHVREGLQKDRPEKTETGDPVSVFAVSLMLESPDGKGAFIHKLMSGVREARSESEALGIFILGMQAPYTDWSLASWTVVSCVPSTSEEEN